MKYFTTKAKLIIFYLAYNFRLGRDIVKLNQISFLFSGWLGLFYFLEQAISKSVFRPLTLFFLIASIAFLIPFLVRKISHMILYITGDRKQ